MDEIATRRIDYKNYTDHPDIYFGLAVVKVAFYIDEMLFRHRLSSNMTEAKNFVAIHVGYLQKQLHQVNMMKHIKFDVVVVHFGIAPFYDTHEWTIRKYLRIFCQWARANKDLNIYPDVNILLSG